MQTIARMVLTFSWGKVIISLGNDLRKLSDRTRNGADLQKKNSSSLSTTPILPPATYGRGQTLLHGSIFSILAENLYQHKSTLKILAAHQQIFHGTSACRGTHFGKPCPKLSILSLILLLYLGPTFIDQRQYKSDTHHHLHFSGKLHFMILYINSQPS